jgi:hypothetical protein
MLDSKFELGNKIPSIDRDRDTWKIHGPIKDCFTCYNRNLCKNSIGCKIKKNHKTCRSWKRDET